MGTLKLEIIWNLCFVICDSCKKSILATEVTEDTEKIYFFLTSYLCVLCGKS